MAVKRQTFWCNLANNWLYFKAYRSVLLSVSPCSLHGGMRVAAVGLEGYISHELCLQLSQIRGNLPLTTW